MLKTNSAVMTQEMKDQESDIIQEYKKLNEQCDYVLEKIAKRKQTKNNLIIMNDIKNEK